MSIDTATEELSTLSLHDALPISGDEEEIRTKMQDLEDTKDDIEEQLKKEAENIRSKSKRIEESFQKEFTDEKENIKSSSEKLKKSTGRKAESLIESISASITKLKDEI